MQNTTDRVKTIVSDVLAIPYGDLSTTSSPKEIETWDSMQHMNLTLAFEQEFGIQFSPDEVESMANVESIIALIDRKLGSRKES